MKSSRAILLPRRYEWAGRGRLRQRGLPGADGLKAEVPLTGGGDDGAALVAVVAALWLPRGRGIAGCCDDLLYLLLLLLTTGMVTIKFQSESPSFQKKIESTLVRFLAHDCLDGPRQRRAF